MGLLDICSTNSYWRGLDYFEDKKVKKIKEVNPNEYDAEVIGRDTYFVHIDINHPKKSTCTCPHANGKSIVCKHKVALYFTIFPMEAKKAIDERNAYYQDLEERERKYDEIRHQEYLRIKEYVDSLSNEELKERLIQYMLEDALEYEEDPYEEEGWF